MTNGKATNNIPKYSLKHFKKEGGEAEMRQFFERNLSNIFPNLIFFGEKTKEKKEGIGHEWAIPYKGEGKTIDTLAFQEKNNKWESLVIIEYKLRGNREDGQTQLEDYWKTFKKSEGNFEKIKGLYNDHLTTHGKHRIKNLKDNCLLILIAEAPYIKEKGRAERANREDIVLIEVQKYGDDKVNFLLISLVNEKDKKEKMKGKLGIKWDSIIIPLKEKQISAKIEIKEGNRKIIAKEIEATETDTKNNNLEQFLSEKDADEKIKDEIRNLDKTIAQTLKNSLKKSEAIQKSKEKHRFFCYYKKGKGKNNQLLYFRPAGKGWEVILKNNQITATFPIRPFKRGGVTPAENFTRYFSIEDKVNRRIFKGFLKEYLNSYN